MLAARFSHDPLSGVYRGMIPRANNHRTKSGALWSAELPRISSIRNSGNCAARVGLIVVGHWKTPGRSEKKQPCTCDEIVHAILALSRLQTFRRAFPGQRGSDSGPPKRSGNDGCAWT